MPSNWEPYDRRDAELHDWRYRGFRALGFSRPDSRMLDESGADLHRMDDLLKAGCSLATAERILT